MKIVIMILFLSQILNSTSIQEDNKNFSLASFSKDLRYCMLIKNKDKKIGCFGIVKRNTGYCQMIKDKDLKNRCLSIALGDSTYCNKIKDKNLKNSCKDKACSLQLQEVGKNNLSCNFKKINYEF